jgi:CheY-like chemotaxis protein
MPQQSSPSSSDRPCRVLVVDDHPGTAEIVSLLLTQLGYCCRSVETGAGAIDEATMFQPDVVVLDIGLPDLSGYEVAPMLRQLLGLQVYLIALTGWGQPEDRVRAFSSGFDRHILKPASAATLREAVQTADCLRQL